MAMLAATACAVGFATPAGAAPAASVVPDGFQPAALSWLDASHGYVFGYADCPSSPACGFLLHTQDAGASWQRLTAPPIALPANHNHVRLSFATASTGFASDGETLEATYDGGQHWSTVSLRGLDPTELIDLSSIAVFNGRLYVVGSKNGGAAGALVYSGPVTANTLNPDPALAPPAGGAYDYGQVLSDGRTLQVVLGVQYQLERYWIATNGHRLAPAPAPCPVASMTPTLAAPRGGKVLALCSGDPADPQPGQQQRQLAVAPAPGAAFTLAAPLPFAGLTATFDAASSTAATVATEGGGVNFLYGSFDGGQTWSTTATIPDRLGTYDLHFVSATTGYFVSGLPDDANGPSALYRTTDGGRSWATITVH
jgi:hypothetical protein